MDFAFCKARSRYRRMTYLTLLICMTFGINMALGDSTSTWRSGPPDGLPELTKLNVECGKEEMTIQLEFSAPYDGTVYSKPNGSPERCVHVAPHSRITEATFTVGYDACGTRSDPRGQFYENTIVVQYDDVVIEAWDEAKKIRCEWHDGYEKSAFKMPITISDLDVVEMNFQGDDVDCWLEVQDGKGPWSAKVEGLVPLGSPLTLVVAIQDSEGHFDMRVKSCIAHDGRKHPIHLTDEDGCVLRPKMMTPFQKTTETKGTASVIAYSHFYAFKFPETVEVTIQCTVEICRHGCPATCSEGRDSGDQEASLPNKEGEDVPTYKDSFPFSTVITSRPGLHNLSSGSLLNTSSSMVVTNASKDEDPLETSPNTNHDFVYDRYPYDLFDLMADDREGDVRDDDNAADEVYYSQLPNIFNEYGKNFPSVQKIHSVVENGTVDLPEEASGSLGEPLPSTEKYTMTTPPVLDDDEELAPKKGMHTSTESEPNATEVPIRIEIPDKDEDPEPYGRSNERQMPDEESLKDEDYKQPVEDQDVGNPRHEETYFREGGQHESGDDPDALSAKSASNDTIDSPDRHGEVFTDSNETGRKDHDYGIAIIKGKISPDEKRMEYKARARKPVDNYEARQNGYQHFRPLSPEPPLTLYNGVPLYYYSRQPTINVEYVDRNGPYLSRYPYQQQEANYAKSKLRRPGRRRGRRDIGENEQLGLKQTLRVIAATDLDFLAKDPEKNLDGKVGENRQEDVCLAPSSLAAGLGLLILANVCVMCVVVFLGYHYCLHKKTKVKTVELLCTELS